MMLDHMKWNDAAKLILSGLERSIKTPRDYDLARPHEGGGTQDVKEVSCSGFGEAIVARM